MPLRDVVRINARLSNCFYDYGKACASRTSFLLVTSLSLICFLSAPTILQFIQTVYNNAIPIPFSLDTSDGQFWLFSPHIQSDLTFAAPQDGMVIKQVRLTNLLQQVDKDLLLFAHRLQESLTMTTVQRHQQTISLDSFCYQHRHSNSNSNHCLVHSPLAYWQSPEELKEDTDWLKTVNDQYRHQLSSSSAFSIFDGRHHDNSKTVTVDGQSMHPLSLFGNVTLDKHGNIYSAGSIILTFVLQPSEAIQSPLRKDELNSVWNTLWNDVASNMNLMNNLNDAGDDCNGDKSSSSMTVAWFQQADVRLQTWYYKFKLLPVELSSEAQLAIVSYFVVFYMVSTVFAKSTQVKSHYLFGLAALVLSIASCTATLGILHRLGKELTVVPWYLFPIVCGVASLENTFLMTTAVLYAGCDMQVKEKIARGLQSVGVPMTTMLFAEILILSLGSAMDSVLVQEFCLFGKVALLVEYALQYTFFIAVLSIDVKRVELADLDDRQISKRLHELSNCDIDAQQNPDFCPIHDNTEEGLDPKTCADCKEFKTHRTVNAVLLCVVILGLCLFRQPYSLPATKKLSTFSTSYHKNDVVMAASDFWNVINPTHNPWKISLLSPHLVVQNHPSLDTAYTNVNFVQSILQQAESHYIKKDSTYSSTSTLVRSSRHARAPPSLFRSFIYGVISTLIACILSVNVPFLLLCLMSVVVTMWLMPQWRRRWVVPLIKRVAIRCKLKLTSFISDLLSSLSSSLSTEYDANGVHLGAISAQEQFNEQHNSNITGVEVKTLSGKHLADLRLLGANGKHGTVVSCDQDGRIILWDAVRSVWMARLDRLEATITNGGALLGDLNPEYYSQPRRVKKWQRAFGAYQHEQLQNNHYRSTHSNVISGCVKIDQGNRWVIAAYDDGSIRVWNVMSGTLACLLAAQSDSSRPTTAEHDSNVAIYDTKHHQHRSQNTNVSSSSSSSSPLQNIRQRRMNHLTPTSTSRLQTTAISSSSSSSFSSHGNNYPINEARHRQHNHYSVNKKFGVDRILAVQFVGVVAEYCHPLVAELAAQQHMAAGQSMDPNTSQNYLVSVHKSGMIREWDLFTGECIQSFASGHAKDVTYLHSVECKAPHRKLGVTWIFTASKDGCVKCWERRLIKDSSCPDIGSQSNIGSQSTGNNSTTSPSSPSSSFSSRSSMSLATAWTCLYSIDAHQGQAVTALSTALPVGGMGILVTGSNQGSVKVWNFETGEHVCTLSKGMSSNVPSPIINMEANNTRLQARSRQQQQQQPSQQRISDHMAGITQIAVTRYCDVDTGPGLCRGCDTCFGNGFFIASTAMNDIVHVWRLERSGGASEHNCNLCSKDYHRQQYRRTKKSTATPGGEDDTFNKLGNSRRRQQQHQRNMSMSSTSSTTSSTNVTNTSTSTPSTAARRIRRHRPNVRLAPTSSTIEDMMNGLLDIEQLAGNGEMDLDCVFLGKVHHVAGRSLVFCNNMILAGVRKKLKQGTKSVKHDSINGKMNEWETWFASLQYYEPPQHVAENSQVGDEDDSGVNDKDHTIPIEVFDLDVPSDTTCLSSITETPSLTPSSSTTEAANIKRNIFARLFGLKPTCQPHDDKRNNNNHRHQTIRTGYTDDDDNDDDDDIDSYSEDDNDYAIESMDDNAEAKEMLPFSTIHHVVPMDGLGLACDYGNFIKVVCLDDAKFAALRRQQLSILADNPTSAVSNGKHATGIWSTGFDNITTTFPSSALPSASTSRTLKNKTVDQDKTAKACQCKDDGSKCCGGKHMQPGGKCCGGTGGSRSNKGLTSLASASPSSSSLPVVSTTHNLKNGTSAIDTGIPSSCHSRPMAECLAKATCSRAGECNRVSSSTKSLWR